MWVPIFSAMHWVSRFADPRPMPSFTAKHIYTPQYILVLFYYSGFFTIKFQGLGIYYRNTAAFSNIFSLLRCYHINPNLSVAHTAGYNPIHGIYQDYLWVGIF